MVSNAFRELEDKTGNLFILHDDLVGELAHKLNKEKSVIEHALYHACVATGNTPVNMAIYVNEFLMCLNEQQQGQDQDQPVQAGGQQ